MTRLAVLLCAFLSAGLPGCAQTDPDSVCSHIAKLQHASAPNASDRMADYTRLCRAPMAQAKALRPAEYGCWSKCIVEVQSWADSVRCDGCVGSRTEFELFQLSKTRKKQEQARDRAAAPSASGAPAPSNGGACAADAACP